MKVVLKYIILFNFLVLAGACNKDLSDDQNEIISDETSFGVEIKASEYVSKSYLNPSLYNHPVLIDEGIKCSSGFTNLRGGAGQNLMRVCVKTYQKCKLEGSCQIQRSGNIRSFNYKNSAPGYAVFYEISGDECFYGFGVQNICLDPYFTIAADLNSHKAGDVIYVPSAKGAVLPNGEIHNGYFIVRDRGGAIKGPNRFDFFSGPYEWSDPENPFSDLGLSDPKNKILYFKLNETAAAKVRVLRGYPGLL